MRHAPRWTVLNRPLLAASAVATGLTLGITLMACGESSQIKVPKIPREMPGIQPLNPEANFVSLATGDRAATGPAVRGAPSGAAT